MSARLDLILMMSVNPGFGGQSFIESTLPKIEAVRKPAVVAARRPLGESSNAMACSGSMPRPRSASR